MTPTTATRKPKAAAESALAGLEKLEAQAADLAGAARALRQQHYAAQQHVRDLVERKRARQHQAPTEYSANMVPRSDTEAAAIEDELGKVGKTDFGEEINRAERLQQLAEQEVAAYRFEHAEAIAREFVERGESVARAANEALAVATEAVAQYQGLRGRFETFVGSLPGAINGRDIRADERVDEIALGLKALSEYEIAGPYSRSLTVRNELERRYVLGPDGSGYIGTENAR